RALAAPFHGERNRRGYVWDRVQEGEVLQLEGGGCPAEVNLDAAHGHMRSPEEAAWRDPWIEVVDMPLTYRASPDVQSKNAECAAMALSVDPDELTDQEAIVDAEVEFSREAGGGPRPGQLTNSDKPMEVSDGGDLFAAAPGGNDGSQHPRLGL